MLSMDHFNRLREMLWAGIPEDKGALEKIIALEEDRSLLIGMLTSYLTLEQLDILWENLGDIPLNYDEDGSTLLKIEGVEESDKQECIDTNFFIWERGDGKYDIWHWFDDEYAKHGTCLADRWFSDAGIDARNKERKERK